MTCIMNISHLWIFLGALVSSNAVSQLNERCTDVEINASLSSQVLLPCHFNKSISNDTVIWNHQHNTLLSLVANGKIYFYNHRNGRVNTFPLLFKEGNFSILIQDLEASDIGMYDCKLSSECWSVKVTELQHPPQEVHDLNPWFYFAAGAGLFILLFIVFSLFSKFCGKDRSSKSSDVNGVQSEGTNPTEEAPKTESRGPRNNNRGLRRGSTVVYENDVLASYPSSSMQQAQHPQRAFRAAPEPPSHPTDVKSYYVNQAELSIQSNAGKKQKKKKHYQFKNPIYGE